MIASTRRLSAVSEINVTPLVDVLLVLLIIFMVVAPLAPRGLDAALPPPASESAGPPGPLVITVEQSGVTLNQQPVATLHDLASQLAGVLATRADRTVFVRAAGVVSYGSVVAVMDAATPHILH